MTQISSLAVIGCGAMGAAIARAVTRKRVCVPQEVILVDSDSQKLSTLGAELCSRTAPLSDPMLADMEIVVLAVKPQDSASVCKTLARLIRPNQLVISIMAGVPVAKLGAELGQHRAVVRSMPNLPAQCGAGMTVYYCDDAVSSSQQQAAQFIFESFGRSLRVTQESLVDSATALSGTGPAYFYFLLQQLHVIATESGYTSAESSLLLEQTMEGALALLRETGSSPEQLIRSVASRGGTTEAALSVLTEGNVATCIQNAVRAADSRSRELAKY